MLPPPPHSLQVQAPAEEVARAGMGHAPPEEVARAGLGQAPLEEVARAGLGRREPYRVRTYSG